MNKPKEPYSLVEYLGQLKSSGVDEASFEKYVGDYFEFSARRNAIPLHGQFELTPLCNLDCKMCYVHLSEGLYNAKDLLPATTWKRIIDEAYARGMRKATLTGGECLTYPDFDEIYLYLHKKNVPAGILTNGVLFNQERIDSFQTASSEEHSG